MDVVGLVIGGMWSCYEEHFEPTKSLVKTETSSNKDVPWRARSVISRPKVSVSVGGDPNSAEL